MNKSVVTIAEIGCNHMGDIKIAKEMIDVAAAYCKADIVKFQKRNPKELLSEEEYHAPHPVPSNSYGETYGAHREFLEFNLEQHCELKEYSESRGVDYSSSVWDITSAKEIASLNPKLIKIPSACNTNHHLLAWLLENYSGEIHVSLGMTYHDEEDDIIRLFESYSRTKDLVIYACTSGYPVPFNDVCLLEISRLKAKFLNNNRCKKIGFSGHHLGISIDPVSIALGATVIERHFTLDRTWKGTDHAASLEPEGFRKLVRDLNAVQQALQYKNVEILEIESIQRTKLKR